MIPFLAWLVAVLGFALAYLIALAAAMKTVPELTLGGLLAGLPLPLLGLLLAAYAAREYARAKKWLKFFLLAVPPLLIAALGLVVILGNYFFQP